jgi:phosphoglucosamine mutase
LFVSQAIGAILMKKLFGTDGIRARAGEFPLDSETVPRIGASLARRFADRLDRSPRFVLGRDTRESGQWIEQALTEGAASAGAEVESAGVITTPGVAFITGAFGFDAGIVISASHNPYEDNGIKVFLPDGRKLDDATERLVEADIFSRAQPLEVVSNVSTATPNKAFQKAYIDHLLSLFSHLRLDGLKIVVDCANGASCEYAGEILKRLGADVALINNLPDGRNINLDCGSLHLEGLQQKIIETNADLGVAFDGDADRALFVDEKGNVADGDATLWILARPLKDEGRLTDSKVVATVMSNIGLEMALRSREIELVRTSVGDKYVLEELLTSGAALGGEQSGHIIMPQVSLVGDGMVTMLSVLDALVANELKLSEAVEGFVRYPQVLVNVQVKEKKPFEDLPAIAETAAELERKLDGSGRLLLRYSGTENLARVMIEGADQSENVRLANEVADVIRLVLG